jgi:D-cysteine desulfhydrase
VLDALAEQGELYFKRDDWSSPAYGGNKIRTLEVLLGQAVTRGQSRVYSTGSYGSNHAVATILHAGRLGLDAGALLCPQSASRTALENLEISATRARPFVHVPHWSLLPLAIWRTRRAEGSSALIMPPGGASPLGALGYVSAALELAEQVRQGLMPSPKNIVVCVGSTCTTAGLLVGVRLARTLGLAFSAELPRLHAIRVTPWPVTSPVRIAHLAQRTSHLLATLSKQPRLECGFAELYAGLSVHTRQIGKGYGEPTASGIEIMRPFAQSDLALDTTYSSKAMAGLCQLLSEQPELGPTLFWCTKSSAPLPPVSEAELRPHWAQIGQWVAAARREPNYVALAKT